MKRAIGFAAISLIGLMSPTMSLAQVTGTVSIPSGYDYAKDGYDDQADGYNNRVAPTGALGIEFENKDYIQNGKKFFRVIAVLPDSSFRDQIHVGDFVYGVNGYSLQSLDDIRNALGGGASGTQASVTFLSSAHALAAYSSTGFLIDKSTADLETAQLDKIRSQQVSTPNNGTQPWCLQSMGQTGICVVGALLAAKLVFDALSSASSSSAGSSYSSPSTSGSPSAGNIHYSSSGHSSEEGKSPAQNTAPVDHGVGCYWGYQSMGTCVK